MTETTEHTACRPSSRANPSPPASLEREDVLPLLPAHRHHREPVSPAHERHAFEGGLRLQLGQGDGAPELALELDVDEVPAGIVGVALRIVVLVLGVEGGGVGIALTRDPCNSRRRRARRSSSGR